MASIKDKLERKMEIICKFNANEFRYYGNIKTLINANMKFNIIKYYDIGEHICDVVANKMINDLYKVCPENRKQFAYKICRDLANRKNSEPCCGLSSVFEKIRDIYMKKMDEIISK